MVAPERSGADGEQVYSERMMRKPLVEKKRRARINESLQELRGLVGNSELQSKMENAEVLEMTVKRVESILQTQNQVGSWPLFSAGYIQCLHHIHGLVSGGLEVERRAAELLHHLLESVPLSQETQQRWAPKNPAQHLTSPAPSSSSSSFSSSSPCSFSSTDDLLSDLEEVASDQNQVCCEEDLRLPVGLHSKSVWRPW